MNDPSEFRIAAVTAPTIEDCPKHPRKARLDYLTAERDRKIQAIKDRYECDHRSRHVVVVVAVNLTRMYCWQCKDCGQRIGDWVKKASLDPAVLRSAPELDRDLKYRLYAEQDKEIKQVLVQYASLWKLRQSLYRVYVTEGSPEWHCRRRAALARDNYTCTICGTRRATQVHHITYAHLGNEPLEDLQSVCEECHSDLHNEIDAEDEEFQPYGS
jgi:hypothetical protein